LQSTTFWIDIATIQRNFVFGGLLWQQKIAVTAFKELEFHTPYTFETMSKRRKGYPSETHVKKGLRVVHGDKELLEKLGRNDLCPCGSSKKFKKCCMTSGTYDGSQKEYYF
jgi:uncharacterized protein YchJ